MDFAWMAWTWPTAAFFGAIATALLLMTIAQIAKPTVERVGLMGVATTRGDRLFISLLSAAFIHLAWLGLAEADLYWASAISAAWSLIVFIWL